MINLISRLSQPHIGINYLIPYCWWQTFVSQNNLVTDTQYFTYPDLNLDGLVDTFLHDFKDQIVGDIEHKCNYLRFNKVILSPQPISNIKWKVIPPQLWKLINKHNKNSIPILTYISQGKQLINFSTIQLQIIFCSRSNSDLFIGYLPQQAPLINIIRQIGFQLGYIQMGNSKLTYPDYCPQKNYKYSDIQGITLKEASDTFIMAYNLQRHHDYQQYPKKIEIQEQINDSNQAVVGQLLTMIDQSRDRPVIDGTLSTGAQTSFSFFGSQGYDLGNQVLKIDREYRMNQLFRQKKPEEVQAMKLLAKQSLKGQLIQVQYNSTQIMQEQLDRMAQDMLEALHIHKKQNKEQQNRIQ